MLIQRVVTSDHARRDLPGLLIHTLIKHCTRQIILTTTVNIVTPLEPHSRAKRPKLATPKNWGCCNARFLQNVLTIQEAIFQEVAICCITCTLWSHFYSDILKKRVVFNRNSLNGRRTIPNWWQLARDNGGFGKICPFVGRGYCTFQILFRAQNINNFTPIQLCFYKQDLGKKVM